MREHLWVTWLAGIRSHSLRVVVVVALLLMGVAYLASAFSGRHPHTMALDVGLSGSKLVLALLAVFWTHELLGKEVDRKTVYFSLSYPLPRTAYLLGRFAGIASLLAVSTLVLGFALYLLTNFLSGDYKQTFSVQFGSTFFLVMALQWLDAMVITGFCVLIASLATTSLMPLAMGLAFAMVARGYGAVYALIRDPNGGFADVAAAYTPLMRAIGFVIPDLGALDWRDAVLYGRSIQDIGAAWPLLQAVAYLAIVLPLAGMLFHRREFQ